MNNFDKLKSLVLNTKIENDCVVFGLFGLVNGLKDKDFYEEQLKDVKDIKNILQQNIILHNVLCMLEDYKEEL